MVPGAADRDARERACKLVEGTPAADALARGATRAFLNAQLWRLADLEPDHVRTAEERLARLVATVGDVAEAHALGHGDMNGELLRVIACALRWVNDDVTDDAA